MTLLVLDNYDSFVQNLARYFRRLSVPTIVVRNDAVTTADVRRINPIAIVISPGPYGPEQTGICQDVVREFAARIPILGVCLGHQVIVKAFGGSVVRAPYPVHGQAKWIGHDGQKEFAGLPNRLQVGRYHSLVADRQSLPGELQASAWSDDGLIMAVRHANLPIFGWQFHPESVLTRYGPQLLAGFLRESCGWVDQPLFDESALSDVITVPRPDWHTPHGIPITF